MKDKENKAPGREAVLAWQGDDARMGQWYARAILGMDDCPARLREADLPAPASGLLDLLGACETPDPGCDRAGCRVRAAGNLPLDMEKSFAKIWTVASLLGLDEVQAEILTLSLKIEDSATMAAVFYSLVGPSRDIVPAMAVVLGRDVASVREAMSPDGALMANEIVEVTAAEEPDDEEAFF